MATADGLRVEAKTALVTGGSRGIGRATAQMLAAAGVRVVVHFGRRREQAEEVVAGLAGQGHLALGADLTSREATRRLAAEAIEALGRVDLLVNNAGVFAPHPPLESDWETWAGAWQSTLAVNLLAAADLCYLVGRHMVAQGGGRIVNISSRGAFRGEPEAPAYGASKAGMNALSQSLAKALAPHGVLVFAVAPGWVETDMAAPYLAGEEGTAVRAQSPLNRIARPEEIARTVLFLASAGIDYVTGAVIDVNGASYLR